MKILSIISFILFILLFLTLFIFLTFTLKFIIYYMLKKKYKPDKLMFATSLSIFSMSIFTFIYNTLILKIFKVNILQKIISNKMFFILLPNNQILPFIFITLGFFLLLILAQTISLLKLNNVNKYTSKEISNSTSISVYIKNTNITFVEALYISIFMFTILFILTLLTLKLSNILISFFD